MSDWKNNRPKNWENPHLYFGSPHSLLDIQSNERHYSFEAGADAYAKALIKGGIRFEPGVYAGGEEALFIKVLQMRGIRAGWLVFIEESK